MVFEGEKNTLIVKGEDVCSSFSPFKIKFLEIFWFFKGFTSLLYMCTTFFTHKPYPLTTVQTSNKITEDSQRI